MKKIFLDEMCFMEKLPWHKLLKQSVSYMLKARGQTKRFTLGTIIEIVKMNEDMNILLIVQGDLGEKCTLTSQHWVVFFMD